MNESTERIEAPFNDPVLAPAGMPGAEGDASGAARDYTGEPPRDAGPAAVIAGPASGDFFLFRPPEYPTQKGPRGILYDFNDGARVLLPEGKWHVRIVDEESGNILFGCDADRGWVVSSKKYYVPFHITIWERGQAEPVLDHVMDLRDKPVWLSFPVGTLGDLIGWFPYAERFKNRHGCRVHCTMAENIIELYRDQYPDIGMSTPETAEKYVKDVYASYRIGLFFGGNVDNQPYDFRVTGLHRTAGHILGVDPKEEPPRLRLDAAREIAEPYVCIATKSTCLAKMWNNGYGWELVISHLKNLGYRVLCIDRERTVGHGFVWNRFPDGAEDFTGSLPLQKRVDLLRHAEFFIGLGSGLSWLAWAARIPVVLISGFSLPFCEFDTPYRVHNTHGCHGCWDAMDVRFDHHDYYWCPKHKGTDRQFECTRLITGKQVIGHIDRLMRDHGLAAPKEREQA